MVRQPTTKNGNLVLEGIATNFSELSVVCDIGERWPQATVTSRTTTSDFDSAETWTDVWNNGERRLVEHFLRTTDYEVDGLMEGKTHWYARDGQVVTPYWSQSEGFNPDPDPGPYMCLDMDIPTFEDQGYSPNEVPREPLQDDDQRWEPCLDNWAREETDLTMKRKVEMRSETRMNASTLSDEDEQFLRQIEEFNDAGRFPFDTPHPGESPPEDAKRNGKDRTDWAKEGFSRA